MFRACRTDNLASAQAALLKNGGSLTKADENGFQPIHVSAAFGRLDLLRWLHEENNVCITTPSSDGYQALHIAAAYGHLDVVKYLHSKGASLSDIDGNGGLPIHSAAFHGHLNCLKWLVKMQGVAITSTKTPNA